VEKTGEGSTPSTVRRGAPPPLHTARKMADMEQRLEQLQAVVTGLSARIHNVMEGQLGLESANNALAASNQDFRTQAATQRARLDKLERNTGELHNQLGDVEAHVDNNMRRLSAVLETVNSLQDSHDNLRNRMEAFAKQERGQARGDRWRICLRHC
jgi:chromosome segregation ATPase